jgi:hypothetical protein
MTVKEGLVRKRMPKLDFQDMTAMTGGQAEQDR